MRKNIFYLFMMIFLFSLSPTSIKADYQAKFISDGKCSLVSKSTGNCFYKDTTFSSVVSGANWIDTGDELTVITSKSPIKAPTSGYGSECKSTYSYVNLFYQNANHYGYACTDNIRVVQLSDELKKEFQEAGFPESYWESLAVMKEAHPNWKFVAIPTGLDFQTAVNNEDSGNKSLIQVTGSVNNQGYLSIKSGNYNWDTDAFTPYDGRTWFAANNETIAFYMDPRNFLSDMYIFQFESLSYDKDLQTLEGVQSLLGNSYISQFSQYFMDAAVKWNMNPIYLASLSTQEVGNGATPGAAISGGDFTYEGKTYSGFYNFYNIGATSGTSGSTARGLAYAAGVKDGKTTYGRPWDTEEKAILGGAQFIYQTYVQYGQDTSYTKKWNTIYNYATNKGFNAYPNYTHQYMQNIQAPSSEAQKTYASNFKLGLLDSSYVFYIPVYNNLPAKTSLPTKGNPNNRLKNISIDGKVLDGFLSSTFDYKVNVENEVKSIKLTASTINSGATVSGTGTIDLKEGENIIKLAVKAQNGTTQTYTVTVVRASVEGPIIYPKVSEIMDKTTYQIKDNYISGFTMNTKISSFKEEIDAISSTATVSIKSANGSNIDTIRTGDTITITSGEDTILYTVIIYGDVNGDGTINALDLLKIQKHILKASTLSGAYKEAADINRDSTINALDLLKIQKHILGDSVVSQN